MCFACRFLLSERGEPRGSQVPDDAQERVLRAAERPSETGGHPRSGAGKPAGMRGNGAGNGTL